MNGISWWNLPMYKFCRSCSLSVYFSASCELDKHAVASSILCSLRLIYIFPLADC